MGLAAIAEHKLGGIVPVGSIFKASARIGEMVRARAEPIATPQVGGELLRVLPERMKLAQNERSHRFAAVAVENQGTAVTSTQRVRATVNDRVDIDPQVLN